MSKQASNQKPALTSVFVHWSEQDAREDFELAPALFLGLLEDAKRAHVAEYGMGTGCYCKVKVTLRFEDGSEYGWMRFDVDENTVPAELRKRTEEAWKSMASKKS